MRVEVIAFGIAKDIVKSKSINLEMTDTEITVRDVKERLIQDFPEFGKLASLKIAVNADYVTDNHELNENDEVVIIPPVSGG